ncbi:MAG: hypothetical protein H7831_13570 [Magnetococcus sp. WYHC-3]
MYGKWEVAGSCKAQWDFGSRLPGTLQFSARVADAGTEKVNADQPIAVWDYVAGLNFSSSFMLDGMRYFAVAMRRECDPVKVKACPDCLTPKNDELRVNGFDIFDGQGMAVRSAREEDFSKVKKSDDISCKMDFGPYPPCYAPEGRLVLRVDFTGGWVDSIYKWEEGDFVPAAPLPQEDPALDSAGVVGDSPEAQLQAAIGEHQTNILYAQKAIEGFRRDLAKARDPGTADQLRFSILHLEQDIHDAMVLIESIRSGQNVHTRGPWERHAEAVVLRRTSELQESVERVHQMQASALRMVSVLEKYAPDQAGKSHEVIIKEISQGGFGKGGLERAHKALAQVQSLARTAARQAQDKRQQDQEVAMAQAEQRARDLAVVVSLAQNADRALMVGSMLTPVGPGALIALGYKGVVVTAESGVKEAVRQVAGEAVLLAAGAGLVKGAGVVQKYLGRGGGVLGQADDLVPRGAGNARGDAARASSRAATFDEALDAARFKSEVELNQALVNRVRETQQKLERARRYGVDGGDLAKLEAAATDAVSAANSSTQAKRILKNELYQAEYALQSATERLKTGVGDPEVIRAAQRAQSEAARRLREVEGVHAGFQRHLAGLYAQVDDTLVKELKQRGYNVESDWFKEFRNATSKGINGDRDLGLRPEMEARLRKNGSNVGLEQFMEEAQQIYNQAYRKVNNGRSAILADQQLTTSAFNEAFPLEFLDPNKIGTASRESCERAGTTIFNKVRNSLAGNDPEFIRMQKAYASLSKDLRTKVLPTIERSSLGAADKARTGSYWSDLSQVMDEFSKGHLDPLDATRKVNALTGGKTIRQVASDVEKVMNLMGRTKP